MSFYVFYSWDTTKNGFDLSKATGKYKEEFENNSDWLRFGFHAKDALAYESLDPETELEYYNKSVSELERIVGKESIDYFLRLDRYYADKETVKALKNSGVEGLLIASGTNRESYALTQEERIQCKEKDWYVDDLQMDYTPTDIQIENIENDSHFYNTVQDFSTQQRIEIFTHEWAFNETNVKKYLTWYAYTMKQNNVKFSFSY